MINNIIFAAVFAALVLLIIRVSQLNDHIAQVEEEHKTLVTEEYLHDVLEIKCTERSLSSASSEREKEKQQQRETKSLDKMKRAVKNK